MTRSLYICYFGMREPLVQTQVLPYIREIMKDGVRFTLLTFEPTRSAEDLAEFEAIRKQLNAEEIDWEWLPYHKRFSIFATAWDILRGIVTIRSHIARIKPDFLHGRVHVPTLMGAVARKLSRHQPKLLFDIRGFMPEEYTDAGIWPEGGFLYRTAKRVESWLMQEADGFVVLTEKARSILFPESRETGRDRHGRPVAVIPCCVDFERRFPAVSPGLRKEMRTALGISDRFVFVHLGALEGLYKTREIVDFLSHARREDSGVFAMFLTQSHPSRILPLLREAGFSESDYLVERVHPSDVQKYLTASDAGLSFVQAGYATASRSPTKIPEYLACGLPVVANSGVGDVDSLIKSNRVGAIVNEFAVLEYMRAFREITGAEWQTGRIRSLAESEFGLSSVGSIGYRRLYRILLK